MTFGPDPAGMFNLLQPIAVDETIWWVEAAGILIKVAAVVTALAVLMKVKPVRKVFTVCAHWLWNNPAVTMTVDGLRDLVRAEVAPVANQLRDVATDVSGLRRESLAQHEAVTDQLDDLTNTVDVNGKRLSQVEAALMNRWRHGER